MSIINIKNLTFGYHSIGENIFENVSLQIDTAWKLGLVGRNGKGKTTFFKLLLGKLEHDGTILSSSQFEYFPFDVKNKEAMVYEVIESINPFYEEWQIQKELNLLEFGDLDLYRQFSSLSHGEQTKILLAVLFSKSNTFLLIDEPTNHLDKHGREILANYLNKKSSFIIISHDKYFLDNCIDHVMSINRANIEIQNGNLSSYLDNKKKQDEHEMSENERLKIEIKHLQETSRQTKEWSKKAESEKYGGKNEKSGLRPDKGFLGAKAAKIMKRATSMVGRMEKSIEEKSSLLKNVDREAPLTIFNNEFAKERFLVIKNLVIKYDGVSINKPLSFEVLKKDRISLNGKNGCGKTSILKAIIGENNSYDGEVSLSKGIKVSYVSQDTSFLSGKVDDFCLKCGIDKTRLRAVLIKLGFEREQFEKEIQNYSDGQKKKFLIAKSLCEDAHLYIWDEPLNYIDIISREQIKSVILSSEATMIFVEHDAEFCNDIATKEIYINK